MAKLCLVAFVIDVYARRIAGWKVSNYMKSQFVLDALEWVRWYNEKRILSLIGNTPPGMAEQLYYDQLSQEAKISA